ncbi:WD40 repeat-like domain-containing protein [Purpureocillium lilacinum]|uniref:Mitochondrial division protein 1 n=1 Tax=Purpureocillium lilacinum TaxID=33203 RepID=A0A2U3EB34_PURLI|nr:hypothetical protein Purlil1_6353 [Purpureocillium lilacinum]PWI71718.1 WD40 repeat-like domain-containing protein [Purpureocillium lilacinum]
MSSCLDATVQLASSRTLYDMAAANPLDGAARCVRSSNGTGSEHTAWWLMGFVRSFDSALVASASYDNTIRLWRVATGECVQTPEGHDDSVTSVAFSSDSTLVASGSDDKTIRL